MKKETAGVKDYYIFPESSWNYALAASLSCQVEEEEVSDVPFSKEHAPVRLKVSARRLEEWREQNGDAREIPESPVTERGEEETVTLLPFGCTKLRVSQFPYYGKAQH